MQQMPLLRSPLLYWIPVRHARRWNCQHARHAQEARLLGLMMQMLRPSALLLHWIPARHARRWNCQHARHALEARLRRLMQQLPRPPRDRLNAIARLAQ